MGSTLDAAGLRTRQAPLKQRYRDDPSAAVVAVSATATFGAEATTCLVDGWAGPVRAGLHTATGGGGDDACSADLLLQALLACAGVTLRTVAIAMSVPIRSARLRADAVFDARGTLGVSREVPVGCTGYRVAVAVDADADDATLDRLAMLTERYCVVGRSLRGPVVVTVVRQDRPGAVGHGGKHDQPLT